MMIRPYHRGVLRLGKVLHFIPHDRRSLPHKTSLYTPGRVGNLPMNLQVIAV
jgi:hypothetical protein